jgi:hypothetical protein
MDTQPKYFLAIFMLVTVYLDNMDTTCPEHDTSLKIVAAFVIYEPPELVDAILTPDDLRSSNQTQLIDKEKAEIRAFVS